MSVVHVAVFGRVLARRLLQGRIGSLDAAANCKLLLFPTAAEKLSSLSLSNLTCNVLDLPPQVYKYTAIAKTMMLHIQNIRPSLKLSTAASAVGAWSTNWYPSPVPPPLMSFSLSLISSPPFLSLSCHSPPYPLFPPLVPRVYRPFFSPLMASKSLVTPFVSFLCLLL